MEGKKWSRMSGAPGVDRPRDELFPGPGLAGDENGDLLLLEPLDGLKDSKDGWRPAHHALVAKIAADRRRADLKAWVALQARSQGIERGEARVREEAFSRPGRHEVEEVISDVEAPVEVSLRVLRVPTFQREPGPKELDPPVELEEGRAEDRAARFRDSFLAQLQLSERIVRLRLNERLRRGKELVDGHGVEWKRADGLSHAGSITGCDGFDDEADPCQTLAYGHLELAEDPKRAFQERPCGCPRA